MISIIIPIRNESKSIERTLKSILNQKKIDEVVEIIIVDGISDDGTRNIIKDYITRNDNIQLIDNPDKIVPIGFNRGLSISKGDIIVRIDGHSEISIDYLYSCISIFNNIDADCVGGATKHRSNGIIGETISIAQSSRFGVGGVLFRKGIKNGQYVDTLAFGAYKKEVFENIGGFDEELIRNQDDEFNFRLIQNGGKIWIDPLIESAYYTRNSFLGLFKQYFQYGFYKIRVIQKRKSFSSWRHIVPASFVFTLILFFIFIPLSFSNLPFYLLSGLYIIVNIFAVCWEILKKNLNHVAENQSQSSFLTFFLLPLAYITLHFSYGLGSIFGLFYFWNKWNDIEIKDSHFISG